MRMAFELRARARGNRRNAALSKLNMFLTQWIATYVAYICTYVHVCVRFRTHINFSDEYFFFPVKYYKTFHLILKHIYMKGLLIIIIIYIGKHERRIRIYKLHFFL